MRLSQSIILILQPEFGMMSCNGCIVLYCIVLCCSGKRYRRDGYGKEEKERVASSVSEQNGDHRRLNENDPPSAKQQSASLHNKPNDHHAPHPTQVPTSPLFSLLLSSSFNLFFTLLELLHKILAKSMYINNRS